MKRLPLFIALVLVVAGAALLSAGVKLAYFRVEHQGNDFLIAWQADLEDDVRNYELFRKTSYTIDFTLVKSFNAHGVGKAYQFRDDQVYKTSSEQVDYRLEVVFNNGLRQQIAEKKVNYTPTAIRRTWGSIKAMFQ